MNLNKKQTYKYVRELLNAEIEVIKDVSQYDLLISQEHFKLENIKLRSDNAGISILNYINYTEQYEKEIKDNNLQITYLRDNANDEMDIIELIDIEQEILNLEETNKQLTKTCEQMERLYKRIYALAKDGTQQIHQEIVYVSNLISSQSLGIKRELISCPIELRINKSDFSIDVIATNNLKMELDMFPINEFRMYTELKEIATNLTIENFDNQLSNILNLLKVSFKDIKHDPNYLQIVIRNRNFHSTLIDYDNIITSIGDDETLDEPEVFNFQNQTELDERKLYFPLAANDEQKEVALKLEHGSVAVQGPPGTGKTHTITNIIAHNLALGNSLLVVSEKKGALEVIHQMLPEKIRPLVIPLLEGNTEYKTKVEQSIRNILARNELGDLDLQLDQINQLEQQKNDAYDQLDSLYRKQISSYVLENANITIYDQKQTLTNWIKQIDMTKVQIDDCRIPESKVSVSEVKYLLEIDKGLLQNPVTEAIEVSKLLSVSEYKDIINYSSLFTDIDLNNTSEINVEDLVPNFTEEYANVFLHWYLCPEEYVHDKQAITEVNEMSKQTTKHMRVLTENDIKIPARISVRQLEELISDYDKSGNFVSDYFVRKKHNFSKDILINEVNFWHNLDNIEVLKEYYEHELIVTNIEKTTQRFASENYFGRELDHHQLKDVCDQFEKLNRLNNSLKRYGINLFEAKYQASNYKLCTNFNKVIKGINGLRKYQELKKAITDCLSTDNPVRSSFDLIDSECFNPSTIDNYEQFVKFTKVQCENYLSSVNIIDIKRKIDSNSKSLYNKLITNECDYEVISNWRDNYIYSEVSRIEKSDYFDQIIECKHKIKLLNVELIEKMTWYNLLKNIGPNEKEAMQTWISLMSKIGKGTGKGAADLRIQAQVEMETIKKVIPVWITTRSQVADFFKYTKNNKFDLVIYDESSQSSINALNILERGKKKLIVGDDKQISPISFVAIDKVEKIRNIYFAPNEHQIIRHDTSLYDYAAAKYKTVSLREHFRSLPEIIGFSNKLQYEGKIIPLRTITSLEKLSPVVESYYVENGTVNPKNENLNEAKAVIQKVKQLIKDPKCNNKSIGIIAMQGNAQDKLIRNMLYAQVDIKEIEKHNIKVANSYAFQGDERDIVILSLVASHKQQNGKLKPLTNQDDYKRYNVAATRAKDKMILVHSMHSHQLKNSDCVRYKLLKYFENSDVQYNESNQSYSSDLQKQIFSYLSQLGYITYESYYLGENCIKSVIEAKEGMLMLECDGELEESGQEIKERLNQQQKLTSAGWKRYRIRSRDYYQDSQLEITKLLTYLKNNALLPVNDKLIVNSRIVPTKKIVENNNINKDNQSNNSNYINMDKLIEPKKIDNNTNQLIGDETMKLNEIQNRLNRIDLNLD